MKGRKRGREATWKKRKRKDADKQRDIRRERARWSDCENWQAAIGEGVRAVRAKDTDIERIRQRGRERERLCVRERAS